MSWSQLLSCSVVEDEAPIFRVGLESGAGERARGLLCGWVLVTTMKQQATVLFPVKPSQEELNLKESWAEKGDVTRKKLIN